jgi:hypothetical protein
MGVPSLLAIPAPGCVLKEPFAAMTNDTSATTFVFDVIAAAPATDVETETSGRQADATLTGATVSSPTSDGDVRADPWLEEVDSMDVPDFAAGNGETSLGTATVTLPSGEAEGQVVLGQGAGAVTVAFVDMPADGG